MGGHETFVLKDGEKKVEEKKEEGKEKKKEAVASVTPVEREVTEKKEERLKERNIPTSRYAKAVSSLTILNYLSAFHLI